MKSSIVFLILVFFSLSLASVNITGRVLDKKNYTPLLGANVVMVQGDNQKGSATENMGY